MTADPARHIVVLAPCAEGYSVSVDPPLAEGDEPRTFPFKWDAWDAARLLWLDLACGLDDRTAGRGPEKDFRNNPSN